MSKAQNIYDDPIFFDGYKSLRQNPANANNLEENPALFSLIPDLSGKSMLDLGCGYGENLAEFKALGASRVLGVDISERMLEVAKKEYPEFEFIRGDMGDLSFIGEHPLMTAPIQDTDYSRWTKAPEGKVLYYNLSDYSVSGKRDVSWIVDGVRKYHRTFSDLVEIRLLSTGLRQHR